MTYRRLFRCFMMGCTLLFAVFWWLSLRPDASFNAFVPGRHFHLRFHRGAVVVVTHAGPYPVYDLEFFRVPAISMMFVQKFPHGPFGTLRIGKADAFPGASGYSVHYAYVVLPIWLAYVMIVGGGLAFLKWAERRSVDEGKLLAEETAAGRSDG